MTDIPSFLANTLSEEKSNSGDIERQISNR